MRRKTVGLGQRLLTLFLCVLLLTSAAHADMGPKSALTITVVNAPEGLLYLDLLAQGERTDHPYFSEADEAEYDPDILVQLRSLEGEGQVLAYSTGLAHTPPVFGDLAPREDGTWRFSYHGLPETFRVAAATADTAQASGVPYTRSFIDSIIYDWEANTVRAVTPPPLRFLSELLVTLLPTLAVEGLILWLFGFRERRTWLVFLVSNVVTQVGLHIFCEETLIFAGSHILFYVLLLLLPELVIAAVEAAALGALSREQSLAKRLGCTLCANGASFIVGYIPVFFWTIFLVLR